VDSLSTVARRRKNPWTSTGEVLLWLLFVALLIPAVFTGYAVGHYTSLGKPPATVTVTTIGETGTVTQPTTTAQTTTTSKRPSGGDAAAGKTVFLSSGCTGCHTLTAAGSTGTTGPDLDKAPATDASAAGMELDAFIKQSITDPGAYVAKGYPNIMPADGGASLTPKQIDDLVAFISANTQK
jgi:mono/diheme cytochrome c family protein